MVLPETQELSIGSILEGQSYHLCDEANLDAFGLWWETRGYDRALTPQEASETDAIVAKDFRTLLLWVKQLKFENSILEEDEG